MRKFFKFITSRFFFLSLILLAQLIAIIFFSISFAGYNENNSEIGYYYLLGAWLLNIPVLIFVANSRASTSYKIGWSLIVSIVPVGGVLFYLLYANKRDTKNQRKKLKPYRDNIIKYNIDKEILEDIKEEDKDAYLHMKYIYNKSYSKPYKNTYTKYFKIGDEAWVPLLEELKKAKHFIFIEYYIIEEGKFWNSILEILKQKVKEGVEVRVMYDDFGCMTKIPYNYHKKLESYGIKCVLFQRYRWFLDVKMNNRDHRKILIIDGHTGFTGGLNFADEYVNVKKRFGEWKDSLIMLKGEGVNGLTIMFLSMWDTFLKIEEDFNDFSFSKFGDECVIPSTNGYVQPYGDIPFDYESVAENVYLNLIQRAKDYVYISTPYFILDDTIANALKTAARSGVDVRILLPGIPDKKITYSLTLSNCYDLFKYGVKFYFYKPGFNHAKLFLSDDKFATVGTINLDLRSFYLNYEDSVFIYNGEAIKEIKDDFDEMFSKSRQGTSVKNKKPSFIRKIWWAILQCFSPMF